MNVLARLRQLTGMNLARSTVERAVRRRMEATGHAARKAYAEAVDEAELQELLELVVVPESWLFRDPQAFAATVEFVRRRLAEGGKLVRILSVPCAGGEEPYSVAMALFDAGVPARAFVIDALDISAACIARAEAGLFGRNAFRGQELSFRDRYFTWAGDDELYRINDAVRARVRFGQGSILEEALGSARQYDVIFCRNLLIYFDETAAAEAIARLSAHLADDGMLLAGYAEVPSFIRHGFAPLPHRQAFALRKDIRLPGVPARPALHARPPLHSPTAAPAGPDLPAQAARPQRAAATSRMRTASSPDTPSAGAQPPARPGRAQAPAPQTAGLAPGKARAGGAAAVAAQLGLGDESLLAHARKLADEGKLLEADSACREYLAQQPESPDAYFILGLLAETAGKPADAEQQLKRCLYLQPDHYEALCHLALLQEQGGNSRAAATLKARAARAYQRQQPQ